MSPVYTSRCIYTLTAPTPTTYMFYEQISSRKLRFLFFVKNTNFFDTNGKIFKSTAATKSLNSFCMQNLFGTHTIHITIYQYCVANNCVYEC